VTGHAAVIFADGMVHAEALGASAAAFRARAPSYQFPSLIVGLLAVPNLQLP
jgi:hypothetical protein